MRILVTGAALRIGAAICARLAADGHQVIIHYNTSKEAAQALATAITQAGGTAHTIGANLADRAQVAALIPAIIARFGPLDCLINNASSFVHDDFAGFDTQDWDFHIGPNLAAPIFLARDFARQTERGCIINMLDHKVVAPNPDFFSYTIAKLAMAGATTVMAQALSGRIRVNAIAPGITLISGKQTQVGFARAFAAPPLGRSATPAEIADAVQYILATPSLNGEILVLDGGESLAPRGRDIAYAVGLE